jgi:hypothetical protein
VSSLKIGATASGPSLNPAPSSWRENSHSVVRNGAIPGGPRVRRRCEAQCSALRREASVPCRPADDAVRVARACVPAFKGRTASCAAFQVQLERSRSASLEGRQKPWAEVTRASRRPRPFWRERPPSVPAAPAVRRGRPSSGACDRRRARGRGRRRRLRSSAGNRTHYPWADDVLYRVNPRHEGHMLDIIGLSAPELSWPTRVPR